MMGGKNAWVKTCVKTTRQGGTRSEGVSGCEESRGSKRGRRSAGDGGSVTVGGTPREACTGEGGEVQGVKKAGRNVVDV